MIGVKYCVTAISRLTGDRDPISLPSSKEQAEKMCSTFKKIPSRKRVYIRPKVEIYQEELFYR